MLTAGLYFAAVLVVSTSAACTRSATCPCGPSKKNYTFCLDDMTVHSQENPCERLSQCETCEHGVADCITCPIGRSGRLCRVVDIVSRLCPDPGIPIGGDRWNADGTPTPYPRTYSEGDSVVFLCRNGNTALKGKSILTCQKDGTWSSPLPTCERSEENPPSSLALSSPECGVPVVKASIKDVNGTRTVAGEWPWMVAISIIKPNNSTDYVCGGVLLNKRTVLSAAHCFYPGSHYVLHFGKFYRRNNDAGVDVRRDTRIIIHPDYNQMTYDNNIALVKLDADVLYIDRIIPICLPTLQSTMVNLVPGKKGIVTSWGFSDRSLMVKELTMDQITVQSDSTCISSYRKRGVSIHLEPGMYCAGNLKGGMGLCRGSSGSPMVFYDKTTEKYTLEGCVSIGPNGDCNLPERYTVFSKISYFMPWIMRNL